MDEFELINMALQKFKIAMSYMKQGILIKLLMVLLLFISTMPVWGDETAKSGQGLSSEPLTDNGSGSHTQGSWTDPVTGMEFVWVPGGCFQMGSNIGHPDEQPVHEVCLDGFWMGKYEVTLDQFFQFSVATKREPPSVTDDDGPFERYLNENNFRRFRLRGNSFSLDGRQPMVKVSWSDAKTFIKWLNSSGDSTFALPTEAQWEYAARSGGKDELYSGGNDIEAVAWYWNNSGKRTHIVGTKAPNGLGIHDMSGNVWEWCEDPYDPKAYAKHSRRNPIGEADRSSRAARKRIERVFRGGNWGSFPAVVRCTDRLRYDPSIKYLGLGFRLVRKDPNINQEVKP